MVETANFPRDDSGDRSYAAWAGKPAILRRGGGTMIRLQSGGLGNLAVILCALSVAGMLAIALLLIQ